LIIQGIELSPSSIALYKACPQKFIYSTLRHKTERPMDFDNLSAADWGTLFHASAAQHYQGTEVLPSGNASVDTRFREYLAHYRNDPVGHFLAEQRVSRPLTPQITLIGTADLVDPLNKAIWDHKTTSRLSTTDDVKFKLRDQFIQYGWCLGWDTGFDVVVNQVSSAGNPTTKFRRISFQVSEDVISDWLKRTTAVCLSIVKAIEKQDAYLWKSAGDACGDWGGCYYADPCRMGLYGPEAPGENLTNPHFSITYKQGE